MIFSFWPSFWRILLRAPVHPAKFWKCPLYPCLISRPIVLHFASKLLSIFRSPSSFHSFRERLFPRVYRSLLCPLWWLVDKWWLWRWLVWSTKVRCYFFCNTEGLVIHKLNSFYGLIIHTVNWTCGLKTCILLNPYTTYRLVIRMKLTDCQSICFLWITNM